MVQLSTEWCRLEALSHLYTKSQLYTELLSVYIAYTQNPFPRDLAAVAGVAKADLRGKADAKLDRV